MMSSSLAMRRQILKEKDPEKYQEYLQKQKVRSKQNRDAKKKKWETEPQTQATFQEMERQAGLARYVKYNCLFFYINRQW